MPTANVYSLGPGGGLIGSGQARNVQDILGNWAAGGGGGGGGGGSGALGTSLTSVGANLRGKGGSLASFINGGGPGGYQPQGFMGANGLPRTFTPGGQGSTPPGMVSTGNTIGGFDKNTQLHGAVSGKIEDLMKNPGLSESTVQSTINKGTGAIEEGRQAAEMDLKEQAAAYGGDQGGAMMGGLRKLATDTTNQKAQLATGVRNDAEKDRLDRQETGTKIGAGLVGGVSDHYGYARDGEGGAGAGGGNRNFQIPLGQGAAPQPNFGSFQFQGNTRPKAPSTAAGVGLGAFGEGIPHQTSFAPTQRGAEDPFATGPGEAPQRSGYANLGGNTPNPLARKDPRNFYDTGGGLPKVNKRWNFMQGDA